MTPAPDPQKLADNPALVEGLAVAVPLRIWELQQLAPDARATRIRQWATDACDQVASHGDDLLFRSKRSGATAKVFNHLACGLAALAHCPGGVTFAGQHWCVGECFCSRGVARGHQPPSAEPPEPTQRRPSRKARGIETIHLPDDTEQQLRGQLELFPEPSKE